jgi:hypothetical protein
MGGIHGKQTASQRHPILLLAPLKQAMPIRMQTHPTILENRPPSNMDKMTRKQTLQPPIPRKMKLLNLTRNPKVTPKSNPTSIS